MIREKKYFNNDENTNLLKILLRVMLKRDRLTRTIILNKVVFKEERK